MADTIRLLRPWLDKPWSLVSRDEVAAAWPKPLILEDCEPSGNECSTFATCHCDRFRYAGRTIAGDVQCSDLFFFSVVPANDGLFADRLETVALVVSAGKRRQLEADVAAFRAALGDAEIRIQPQGRVWSAWIHWVHDAGEAGAAPLKGRPTKR
jgi:hypothetical protein